VAGTLFGPLIARTGTIADGGGTTNVSANALKLDAADGVGTSAFPLETIISQLSAQVSTSLTGGIYIENAGNATITEIAGLAGMTTQGGDVALTAAGSITIDEPIQSAGGDVFHTATEDITVNAPVITGNGNFTATADSDANGTGTFTGTGDTAPALPSGAVLHYAFDAASAANNSTVADTSGTGNNGTLFTNDANASVTGRFGNALDFQGQTADYVIANPVGAWPTNAITMSMWVNSTDTGPGSRSMFSYASSTEDNELLVSNPQLLRLRVNEELVVTNVNIADGRHSPATVKSPNPGAYQRAS
jgi:hypothetical protein